MYFRFGAAILLVVAISLVGIAVEKKTLETRREISRQHFRKSVLLENHARLRLRTQQLGAPKRMIETLESGDNKPSGTATPKKNVTNGRRRVLLHWERPAPSAP